MPTDIPIKSQTIDLDQFLKLAGVAQTGGHAKFLIKENQVTVNDQPETRRRRTLNLGDIITVEGDQSFRVTQQTNTQDQSP